MSDLPTPSVQAPDAQLLAGAFGRVEVMYACRPWEAGVVNMLACATYEQAGRRIITSIVVRCAPHVAEVPPPEPGEDAIAAAILGCSTVILGQGGHRARELFGIDLDGRRLYTRRCQCCGGIERDSVTPASLSRRDFSDPLRSARANDLARRLAVLLPRSTQAQQGTAMASAAVGGCP